MLSPSADHLRGESGEQLGQTLDVVGVVVGQPNLAQRPATAIKLCHDRRGLGHIDEGHRAAVMIAQQEGVVVRQTWNRDQIKGHGVLPRCVVMVV